MPSARTARRSGISQAPWSLPGAFVTGTIQLGDPSTIAERLGAPVVSDFRARDMAAGGQGAPLVPMVDWLLFRHATANRAMQNIGGVGNVTWLPACGGLDSVIAFDTGPGNMVIDAAARLLTSGALKCDEDGRMALRGTVHEDRVAYLMAHEYFGRRPPKSTGRELFGAAYSGDLVRNFRALGMSEDDVMATFTALHRGEHRPQLSRVPAGAAGRGDRGRRRRPATPR